ncbi:MAG: hypothetical protein J6O50_10115 [Ruminiclostridium sp.]|nr:hypothetical protein [Ruminiclostridium sp.]
MESWIQTLVSVVIALAASGGFWTFIAKKHDTKSAKTQMIIGLGHDRIMTLGKYYIERGSITADEYENLYEYLYKPYEFMGGNGSAKQIMDKVRQLPMK